MWGDAMGGRPLDARTAYEHLLTQSPYVTSALPRDQHGIYMLWDHQGCPRYIGMADKDSFHKRIDGRHRGGSEENSHKFSAAYNTGRMWRDRNRLGQTIDGVPQTKEGAVAAKRVRMEFIRQHCRVTFFPILPLPGTPYRAYVQALEASIQSIASPDHRAWETQRLIQLEEPVALVDSLVSDMVRQRKLSERECRLLEDQRSIYRRLK